MKRLIIVALVGVLLGSFISKYLFVGSWLNLVLWGTVGVSIGWFAQSKKESLADGALFGFVLSFSFMMAGYGGSMSRISRVLPFSVLGVFGAICGMALGIIGQVIVTHVKRKSSAPN